MAAVSVVFPWSTCPIVPTFTCGFVRSNFAFAIATDSLGQAPLVIVPRCRAPARRISCAGGAHDRNRTGDLLLTMEMLYRLSYVGAHDGDHPSGQHGAEVSVEGRYRPKREG